MIQDDEIIIFKPEDQPELAEVHIPEPEQQPETPEPTDWRPFGVEW